MYTYKINTLALVTQRIYGVNSKYCTAFVYHRLWEHDYACLAPPHMLGHMNVIYLDLILTVIGTTARLHIAVMRIIVINRTISIFSKFSLSVPENIIVFDIY